MDETSAPSTPPVIELRRVSKKFERQGVLRDVSFSIRQGETVAVIGESGCGKSVTLKLMVGLQRATNGEVLLDGRPLTDRNDREMTNERLRFGFVFQGAALFDSQTVAENVGFGLRQNTDLTSEEIDEIIEARLREVGLPPSVCQKKPAELSGGMRKRVGLARALALSPEIMLYDEPTTGLDPIMSDVINRLIVQTKQSRPVTSIVVTHDMTTVRRVANRVLMLYPLPRLSRSESQVIFDGTPDEAFASSDSRVSQFVHGEAAERMEELAVA